MIFTTCLGQLKNVLILVSGLLIAVFGSFAEATVANGMIDELYFSTDDEAPLQVTLRENFGETIGYLGNYQTLEAELFLPTSIPDLWEFVDFRVHHFDDNTYGGMRGLV